MVGFEIRNLICAIPTLILLVQYIVLAWLDNRVPRWVLWTVFGPLTIPFAAQNAIYNRTVASWLFDDAAQEWFTTSRLKRMRGDPRADRFAAVLNYFDEGHV